MADEKITRIQLPGDQQAQEYIGTHRIENSGALTLTRPGGGTLTFGPGQWTSVEGERTGSAPSQSTPDATSGTPTGADSAAESAASSTASGKK